MASARRLSQTHPANSGGGFFPQPGDEELEDLFVLDRVAVGGVGDENMRTLRERGSVYALDFSSHIPEWQ
jgi:hypothetical protein